MDSRKVSRQQKPRNTQKEVAAFLAGRANDSMGAKFSELAAICGNPRAIYLALDGLTRAGWRFGRKTHADGSLFVWAVSDSSGARFPTNHFRADLDGFAVPMLAERPAEECTQ